MRYNQSTMKKNLIILFSAVVLAVGLSSCGIYGKFKSKTDESIDTLKIPECKEIFTDTYLQALIDTALANNLDLKIAHENVEQANATLLGAKLAYIPSVALSPSAGWGKVNANASPGWGVSPYGFAQASWEVDIFGRLTNRKRIANASKKQMEDLEQASRVELVSAVAELYYELLVLDAQITTTDSAAVNFERSVETMRNLKLAGLADEAAVAQFQGKYYQCLAMSKSLRLARVTTESAMRLLLNKSEYQIARGGIEDAVKLPNTIQEVNMQVLRIRPDVKAAEHQLEQAFYTLNLARANCCPSISITGSLGCSAGLIFNAVGSLVQPLFNSGKNIAEVRGAKHQLKAVEYQYSKALLVAATEVEDALASEKYYRDQESDYTNQVTAISNALDYTLTKMRVGVGTYLEVLTAQNDLLNVQITQIENYGDILKAGVKLYQAIGGGKQ